MALDLGKEAWTGFSVCHLLDGCTSEHRKYVNYPNEKHSEETIAMLISIEYIIVWNQ